MHWIERHILKRLAFADRWVRFGWSPDAIATIPAAHPQVGDVQVWDDEPELLVSVEHITHVHMFCRDSGRYLHSNKRCFYFFVYFRCVGKSRSSRIILCSDCFSKHAELGLANCC